MEFLSDVLKIKSHQHKNRKGATNTPCPVGFRLPTEAEQTQLVTSASISNYTDAASSNLAFTAAGLRNFSTGSISSVGSNGNYWGSTDSGTLTTRNRNFYRTSSNANSGNRAYGFSVRCLKD